MARYIGDLSEHILADCRAKIFRLNEGKWETISNENFALVQLVREIKGSNFSSHRIRGTAEISGESIINVALEKDVGYTLLGDKSFHQLDTAQNTFLLNISNHPSGEQFGHAVLNILHRKEDTPPSPRQAWMPAASQSPPILSPQPIHEQLVNSSDAGKKSPLRFQQQSMQRQALVNSGLSVSTPSLAPAYKPRAITPHRVNAQTLDSLCEKLAVAICTGDVNTAAELSQSMAQQKLQLNIKPKNPKTITVNGGADSFSLRIVVEDRETSGGSFSMNVSPRTTIEQLQQEVADRYGFPPKVQKWIIAKKLATPSDTLSSLNVKHTGSTAYLYLVSGQSVGLKREEFEHFVSRSEERRHAGVFMSMEVNSTQAPVPIMAVGPGAAISRTSSLPHVNSTRPLSASSAEHRTQREVELLNVAGNPVAGESNLNGLPLVGGTNSIGLPVANELHQQIGISVQQGSNVGQTVGNPVVEQSPGGGIHLAQSIQDIQQALRGEEQAVLPQSVLRGEEQAVPPASIADIQRAIRGDQPQARLAQEETEIPSQGWICPSCTLVNSPTRPGCEICSTERPANYVVPQNPRITEQERRRLEREREETELLQQAGIGEA